MAIHIVKRSVFVVGIMVLGCAIIAAATNGAGFRLSHKLHVETAGAACEDCHEAAATADASSANLLPPVTGCTACHDAAEVAEYGYTGEAAPERELIFSHRTHATTVGLTCEDCHSGIRKATEPPSGLPEMAPCVHCHNKREMAGDCGVCHSQVALRRPGNHVADWILDHVEYARSDAPSCAICHTRTYCQECHDGAALGLAIRGEAGAPADRIGPTAAAHEGSDLLILQRTHNLNYIFTHGTEVRSKTSDCATCHEMPSFCNACHNPEDDARRFRPVWHGAPGAFDFAHAEMARNDIEACAACHDVSATEPECLRCHQSTVSPHSDGFMEDIHGDWHDNDDAVCFVCHDNSRHAGQGFCGRCHGRESDD
ncbi:MAG TPA: cytochrome c3 family protein [Acidobacteriota bacterium]|nr:cytochrome c3 family protein [Acidobacteriota bacterium]